MKKTILIVGANSYLAKTFVNKFSERYNFLGLQKSRINSDGKYNEFIEWDISKDKEPDIKQEVDTLIHYACMDMKRCEDYKREAMKVNVLGTFNLLELAAKKNIKEFIYISSGGVFREADLAHTEDDEKEPANFYSLTKILSEKICRAYSKDLKIVVTRPFFPYGPGTKPNGVINRLINGVKNNIPILLNNEGKPIINPCYINDFNFGLESIIREDRGSYSDYNLGGPQAASIKEISETIGNLVNKVPLFKYTQRNSFNLLSDNAKINKIFKPRVYLEEGILRTLKGLEENDEK